MGHSLPHLPVRIVGIIDGAGRCGLGVVEVLVYPFDEGLWYLFVFITDVSACPPQTPEEWEFAYESAGIAAT